MKEKELRELFMDLSLEEKVGQMVQVTGAFLEEGAVITGPAADAGLTPADCRLAGSVLGIAGAGRLREVQGKYMESHPHHIPLLMMADVIHGYRTIFPIPLGVAASFDPEAAEKAMRAAAAEASAAGLHVTFSPMTDLVRDPRWGRVLESFGESPWLSARLAQAFVRGYQGEGNRLSQPGNLAACDKHFVGYGAPVGGREYNHSELSEHTLREYYLPPKIAAIQAGSACVMPSFQSLNGSPCTASPKIVRDMLRGELGFSGVTISDWGAVGELTAHGVAEDAAEAAKLAVNAGVDIDMMSVCYARELAGLVRSGQVKERLVDEAVWRILCLKNSLGLFEDPFHGASPEEEKRLVLSPGHLTLARELAAKSLVLLENRDHLLPLSPDKRTAFAGPYVDSRDTCGSWAIFQNGDDTVTLRRGVLDFLGARGENASFSEGCAVMENAVLLGFGREERFGQRRDRESVMEAAVKAAAEADCAVLALGEHTLQSGEAASRSRLSLPDCQMELLRRVAAVNDRVVAVIYSGRPLVLTEVRKYAKAMVFAFLPGTMGGAALADVLYGKVSPSGRLPMSFPRNEGQIPVYHNEFSTGRPYKADGAEQKFVSRYLDVENSPLYSFGYGLSYGEFAYSPVRLTADRLRPGGKITASVTVKNVGATAARETVQLYIRDEKGSTVRPVRELKALRTVELLPGESRQAEFEIREEMLRIWDSEMKFRVEPGKFTVYIGHDSGTENGAEFQFFAD